MLVVRLSCDTHGDMPMLDENDADDYSDVN